MQRLKLQDQCKTRRPPHFMLDNVARNLRRQCEWEPHNTVIPGMRSVEIEF
jgi:hypothetical protein